MQPSLPRAGLPSASFAGAGRAAEEGARAPEAPGPVHACHSGARERRPARVMLLVPRVVLVAGPEGGWGVRRAGVSGRLRLPLVLVAVAVAYGTAGYQVVEGWGALDAFYMTVTTLTTVGYGEVHPLDAAGKLFTISLLALGVVALAAAVSAFTQLVAGGELAIWLRRKRMDTSLGRMHGHYIVCAYG